MASSLTPAAAASRICAHFSLRTACLPPLSKAVSSSRSAWFRSKPGVARSIAVLVDRKDLPELAISQDQPVKTTVPRY